MLAALRVLGSGALSNPRPRGAAARGGPAGACRPCVPSAPAAAAPLARFHAAPARRGDRAARRAASAAGPGTEASSAVARLTDTLRLLETERDDAVKTGARGRAAGPGRETTAARGPASRARPRGACGARGA
jgi:hypothetical protein